MHLIPDIILNFSRACKEHISQDSRKLNVIPEVNINMNAAYKAFIAALVDKKMVCISRARGSAVYRARGSAVYRRGSPVCRRGSLIYRRGSLQAELSCLQTGLSCLQTGPSCLQTGLSCLHTALVNCTVLQSNTE